MIVRIDASSLKESNCLRRLYWRVVEGYRAKGGVGIELHYGTCFHKFAELIARGIAPVDAMRETQEDFCAVNTIDKYGKDYLNVAHLTRTCLAYLKQLEQTSDWFNAPSVINTPDGQPMVECKFSIPLVKHGDIEFLLQGTIDRITRMPNGCIILEDFKTTASKDPAAYFKGFKMGPQLQVYSLVLRMLAEAAPDGPYGKLLRDNPQIGCRIKGIFYDPKKETVCQASDMFFYSEDELSRFHNWLLSKCQLIADYQRYDWIPSPEGSYNDTCRSSFGSYCSFFDICHNESKLGKGGVEAMLTSHFEKKEYRPLEFGGGHNKQKDLTSA
jgi:hypothetical protein